MRTLNAAAIMSSSAQLILLVHDTSVHVTNYKLVNKYQNLLLVSCHFCAVN